jgi:hypothetical protein
MLSAYNDLSWRKFGNVDAFVCKSESWPTLLSTIDSLLQARLRFFDRWWESWKQYRHHAGNSMMGAQRNQPSR